MFFQSPRTGPALKISQARLQRQNGNGREQGEPEPGAGLDWCGSPKNGGEAASVGTNRCSRTRGRGLAKGSSADDQSCAKLCR